MDNAIIESSKALKASDVGLLLVQQFCNARYTAHTDTIFPKVEPLVQLSEILFQEPGIACRKYLEYYPVLMAYGLQKEAL